MNSPRIFALVLLLAVTSYSGLACAETSKERAEALYRSGAESYFKGEILMALSAFQQGYELDPNAMFLYNISLCYGKLQNYSEALTQAEMAHVKGLPPEVSDKNLARVSAYHAILKSQLIAAMPIRVATCDSDSGACADQDLDSSGSQKPSWLGWTGVGAAALGGGLLVGAMLVDSGLDADIAAYDEALAQADLSEAARLRSDIDDQQALGKVLLISGGVLAATGVGLFIYDLLDTEAVAIVPVVGDQVGAVLIQRF